MKENATLKKISDMLQISISTVSRALNNHPDVSEATKKKVWEIAKMIDYEPNTYAINLRTNKSKVFGIIIPAINNLFYDSVIAALEEDARQNGYSLMILQSSDNPDIEIANLRFCKQNRVSGIFVALTKDTTDISSFLKVQDAGIPIIFIDKVPQGEIQCNRICMDDEKAAIIAAETLVKKGKKNILALFGNSHMSISQVRKASFNSYFQHLSLADVAISIHEANDKDSAYTITLKNLQKKSHPDAIFCMSDEILTGVMKAVQQSKLSIPKELGVIALSNGVIPRNYFPEITYVETSGYKLGKLAYTRMLAMLAGNTFVQNLKIDTTLYELDSL